MKTNVLLPLSILLVSLALVACGSGSGDETGPDNSSEPVREVSSEVPSQARVDGQAFVNWLQTLFADVDPFAQPIQVDSREAVPVDEAAKPQRL